MNGAAVIYEKSQATLRRALRVELVCTFKPEGDLRGQAGSSLIAKHKGTILSF